MTDLPEISDGIERVILRGLIERRVEVEGPDFDYADSYLIAYARSVRAALERAGYRPEADVIREAADQIDPGPVSTRRPAVNDLDDMQMTCDRGVAARLRLWADIRERYGATALDPAQPLPVADGSEVLDVHKTALQEIDKVVGNELTLDESDTARLRGILFAALNEGGGGRG